MTAASLRRLAIATVGVPAVAFSQAPGLDAPTPVIEGFRSTCLAAHPDLDRAASLATADHWVEQKALAPKRKRAARATAAPRLFQKDAATLVLAKPNPALPGTTVACLVTGMANGSPDVRNYANTVATTLRLPPPTWSGTGPARTAAWTVAGGIVRATVTRYRDTRSYSLQISQ